MATDHKTAVSALEAVFGKASAEGFGSAVFSNVTFEGNSTALAKQVYASFLGDKTTGEYGHLWMENFGEVSHATGKTDIVETLNNITDPDAKRSVPLLIEIVSDAEAAKAALQQAFDADDISELSICKIGDGEAMSGLVVSGIYSNKENTSVIALMD